MDVSVKPEDSTIDTRKVSDEQQQTKRLALSELNEFHVPIIIEQGMHERSSKLFMNTVELY